MLVFVVRAHHLYALQPVDIFKYNVWFIFTDNFKYYYKINTLRKMEPLFINGTKIFEIYRNKEMQF